MITKKQDELGSLGLPNQRKTPAMTFRIDNVWLECHPKRTVTHYSYLLYRNDVLKKRTEGGCFNRRTGEACKQSENETKNWSTLFFSYKKSRNRIDQASHMIPRNNACFQWIQETLKPSRGFCIEGNTLRREKKCRDSFLLALDVLINYDYYMNLRAVGVSESFERVHQNSQIQILFCPGKKSELTEGVMILSST